MANFIESIIGSVNPVAGRAFAIRDSAIALAESIHNLQRLRNDLEGLRHARIEFTKGNDVPGLRAALRQIEREVDKEIRAILRELSAEIARDARTRAPRDTGRLRGSIRPFASGRGGGLRAGVRAGAVRRSVRYPQGYNYPRRLEYERGGVRAFMAPALKANEGRVDDLLEQLGADIGAIWEQP